MKEAKKLAPKLRLREFLKAAARAEISGDSLFDQISNRSPELGLPVLVITQDQGAIPRHMIDCHVSVTEESIGSYKVVQVSDCLGGPHRIRNH
jgi:type I restriction enzyme, S subunit